MPGKRPEPSLEFVQLLTSHQSRLYAYVLSLLGNRTQAEDVMQEEKQRLLSECIGKLNERYQELIRRRYTEGATLKSIATQSGQSENSIKQALFRARAVLIECVKRERREEAV